LLSDEHGYATAYFTTGTETEVIEASEASCGFCRRVEISTFFSFGGDETIRQPLIAILKQLHFHMKIVTPETAFLSAYSKWFWRLFSGF
jgi:hypothetical protein